VAQSVRPAPGVPASALVEILHERASQLNLIEVPLGRGPDVVQVRLVQKPKDVLRGRPREEGLHGFWKPHSENPPRLLDLQASTVDLAVRSGLR
jgi:hypothetical protein